PIEANLLKKLLIACTTECPFFHVDGTMYLQTDGVSMGSPLGVTMANFYMTALENKILECSTDMKPHKYCRYADDCFIVTDNIQSQEELKNSFERNSVLKFTSELGLKNKINFPDVHMEAKGNNYATSVYQKPTNAGIYLHANSETPQRYKDSTIKALIHRTYKISSSWHLFHSSIVKLKQSFINNGYSNTLFDNLLRNYLLKVNCSTKEETNRITHTIYYLNQYS
ncbi:Reverse transcriptase domain, partial [Trinorchestia longiramus]